MMEVQDGKPFMGNWMCIQTLGEGSYGEVKLLKHQRSGDCLAVKIVNLKKHKDADDCVRKEVQIQAALNHPNIIRYYGRKREVEQKLHYIYLEYAPGGELFNRIEPDHGMPYRDAQKYMKQLLSGVEYLHQKGITHRDLKPENLLLDQHGNLKIIDFGMATIFRFKGKERLLDKRCGTLPYVAPEVLQKSYLAQPADIWSCGIVLVAMVGGELPWTEPLISCKEYKDWITDQYLLNTPWSKLNTTILSLARKILTPDASNRPSIQQVVKHPWMLTSFTENEATGSTEEQFKDNWEINDKEILFTGVTLSQPMPCKVSKPEDFSELLKNRDDVYFSQPVRNDNLFICSQAQSTQTSLTQNDFRHLIRRITRFFVTTSCEKTVEALGSLLDRLHYTWSTDHNGVFTITTVDDRKMQLIFKANIINMDGKLLLDFILTKGCGLEFKRRFIKIKRCLNEILLQ